MNITKRTANKQCRDDEGALSLFALLFSMGAALVVVFTLSFTWHSVKNADEAAETFPTTTTSVVTSTTDVVATTTTTMFTIEPQPFFGLDRNAAVLDHKLPGIRYGNGPRAGTSLAVVGVDYDDKDGLNVRDVPAGNIIAHLRLTDSMPNVGMHGNGVLNVIDAEGYEHVTQFSDWENAIVATGRSRQMKTTLWHEIRTAGFVGWSSDAYLAQIGPTVNVSLSSYSDLEAEVMPDLAEQTAILFLQSQNLDLNEWDIVDAKQPAIYGEAIMFVDLIDKADNIVKGYRLRVAADYDIANWDGASDAGPYTLSNVEARVLCHANQPPHRDGTGCLGA